MMILFFIKKRGSNAFTLVELMVAVAIIGLLSAVAVPAYQKYIVKSKVSEGLLGLRDLHDKQIVFVSSPINFRDATYGDVSCRSTHRFATTCMYTSHPTSGGFHQTIPSRKKARRMWFGYNRKYPGYGSYNHANKTCSGTGIVSYTDPELLHQGTDYFSGSSDRWRWVNETPGYFGMRAWSSSALAAEAGVQVEQTSMLWALSDLDGDVIFPRNNSAYRCSTDPRAWDGITILGRSMYFKDGEIHSGGAIMQINVGE